MPKPETPDQLTKGMENMVKELQKEAPRHRIQPSESKPKQDKPKAQPKNPNDQFTNLGNF